MYGMMHAAMRICTCVCISQPGVMVCGVEQEGNGAVCPTREDTTACNLGSCDCTYSDWTTWTVRVLYADGCKVEVSVNGNLLRADIPKF